MWQEEDPSFKIESKEVWEENKVCDFSYSITVVKMRINTRVFYLY